MKTCFKNRLCPAAHPWRGRADTGRSGADGLRRPKPDSREQS